MANDRLFIRCDVCGHEYMIAKFWGGHFDLWTEKREYSETRIGGAKFIQPERPGLDSWLLQHLWECENDFRFSVVNEERSNGTGMGQDWGIEDEETLESDTMEEEV